MASIGKLSVRGIRAFSPDDEEQVISFCFPLTIIVGANGCGKTTIIESLKYATTGSLPPGNKAGQAFVHDPKSAGSSSVKASIKLRFANRAGKSMVVVRSMELNQRKTTMAFKALDGILRTTDSDGNRVSLSHKCSELDRQIPQLLGVNKPVLEHVVFCHQEDSSWPLMEGAVLKKRFDDIFDSTRYAKALDEIKVTRKRYQGSVKDLKADLNLLAGHKHAAGGYRLELDKCREALSDITDDIHDLEQKVREENVQRTEVRKILDEREAFDADIESKQAEIDVEEARMSSARNALRDGDDLTSSHTREQLTDMLRGLDRKGDEDRKAFMKAETAVKDLKKELEELARKRTELARKEGMLQAEQKGHDDRLRERIGVMEEVSNSYGLDLSFSQFTQGTSGGGGGTAITQGDTTTIIDDDNHGSGSHEDDPTAPSSSQETYAITTEDMEAFQRGVERKRRELSDNLDEHRRMGQIEEDNLQGYLRDLSAKLKSIENDLERFQIQKSRAMEELRNLGAASSRTRKSDIEEARRSAEKYAKRRDEMNADPRRSLISREIKDRDETIVRLKHEIDEENLAVRELRRCADEQNAVEILRVQVAQDLETLEQMVTDNSFLLQKHDVVPSVEVRGAEIRELSDAMEDVVRRTAEKAELAQGRYDDSDNKWQSIKNEYSKENALLLNTRQNLESRKAMLSDLLASGRGVQRINQIVRAIRSFEHSQGLGETVGTDVEPQRLLEYMTERIGELTLEEDRPESISRTIKKLRKLSQEKDEFEPTEVQVFNSRMKSLADITSSDIVKIDRSRAQQSRTAVKNYEVWRTTVSKGMNDWLDHRRIVAEVETMENSIRNSESTVEKLQADIDASKEATEDLKRDNNELLQLQDLGRRLRDETDRISEKRTQMASRKDELSMNAPSANGKDLRTLEDEVSSKIERKDFLLSEITNLNKESARLNSDISKFSNQAAKAENLLKDKEEKFVQEQEAVSKKKDLNDDVSRYKDEEGKLRDQLNPIRQKVRIKETEKLRFRVAVQTEEKKLSESLNQFTNDIFKITSISKAIDSFASSKKLQDLNSLHEKLSSLNIETTEKEEAICCKEPEVEAFRKRVGDQAGHRKNVESNIGLLDMAVIGDDLESELALVEEKREQLQGVETAIQDYDEITKEIRSYESEMSRREGSRETFKVQQRELKRKLVTSEYNDIDERHRVKMIQHETSIITVSDLDKYYNALDKALLRFHGLKIEEINKIIQELWSLTYKGEDITSIRLTSDQEKGSRATTSYNYRVVMTKGTAELDMRGRCSAGQRVLASIVIRLALAETFCLSCGVMALDEPTTNLDYANKRGLGIALAHIIASRAAQENFQLVIITHDEEFVSMMKNELSTHTGLDMPERYFQVSREEGADGSYYSKIHAIDWDEI